MSDNLATVWGVLTPDEKTLLYQMIRSVTYQRKAKTSVFPPSHMVIFLDRKLMLEVAKIEHDSLERLCSTRMFDSALVRIQKDWAKSLPHHVSLIKKLEAAETETGDV